MCRERIAYMYVKPSTPNIHVCRENNIHGSMQITYMDARLIEKLTYMYVRRF